MGLDQHTTIMEHMGGRTSVKITKVLMKRQWTEAAPSYASVTGGEEEQPTTWVEIQAIKPETDSETYCLRMWEEEDEEDGATFGRDFWLDQAGEMVLKKPAPANKRAKVQQSHGCDELLDEIDSIMKEATQQGVRDAGLVERAQLAGQGLANAKATVHQHKLEQAADEILAATEDGKMKMKMKARAFKEQHEDRQRHKRGREQQEEDEEMVPAEDEEESDREVQGGEAEGEGSESLRILVSGSFGGIHGKSITVSLQNVQAAATRDEPSFMDVLKYIHRKGILPSNMGLDHEQMKRARTFCGLPAGAAVPVVPQVSMGDDKWGKRRMLQTTATEAVHDADAAAKYCKCKSQCQCGVVMVGFSATKAQPGSLAWMKAMEEDDDSWGEDAASQVTTHSSSAATKRAISGLDGLHLTAVREQASTRDGLRFGVGAGNRSREQPSKENEPSQELEHRGGSPEPRRIKQMISSADGVEGPHQMRQHTSPINAEQVQEARKGMTHNSDVVGSDRVKKITNKGSVYETLQSSINQVRVHTNRTHKCTNGTKARSIATIANEVACSVGG